MPQTRPTVDRHPRSPGLRATTTSPVQGSPATAVKRRTTTPVLRRRQGKSSPPLPEHRLQ
eukprot:7762498-Prorocentrum_lima.AAC.1